MDNLKECECGLTYVVGTPDEEAAHDQCDQWHQDHLHGPSVLQVQALPTLASKESLCLVMVNNSVNEATRKAVAKVAMVAQRAMPEYKAGWDGSKEDSRIYALVNGTRIVGMVITSNEKHLWKYTWNSEGYDPICDAEDDFFSGPKISRVWIAGTYRRRSLAKWLVSEVGKHLDCDVQNLGWEMPFTIYGEKLVRSVCPDYFLGCGGAYSH